MSWGERRSIKENLFPWTWIPELELFLLSLLRSRRKRMNSTIKMGRRGDPCACKCHIIKWASLESWLGMGNTLFFYYGKNLPLVLWLYNIFIASSLKTKDCSRQREHGFIIASGRKSLTLHISLTRANNFLYKCCCIGRICFNWHCHGLSCSCVFKQFVFKLSRGFI